MPLRAIEKDDELRKHFVLTVADDRQTCQLQCIEKEPDGGPCPAAWEIELEDEGAVSTGVRNALLSHARSHSGGFRKMRRIS
jgi:hypothetical protein